MAPGRVRWGITGTAKIARTAFLPAVAETGGAAAAVAGRDPGRTEQWARANGVARVLPGYQQLIDDPDVDAVYLPLPNSLHAEWAIRALRAGKPVLCEKPLTTSPAEAAQVLDVAAQTGTLLWEAFVFPFHEQMSQVRGLLSAGAIGELREIQSAFHFTLARPEQDIRMSAALGGGALYDVGCYPVALARHLFAAEHLAAVADAVWDPAGAGTVDLATWGHLVFPDERRLMLSCGFRRALDRFTRLLGTAGQIHMTDPFHPSAADRYLVLRPGREPESHPAAGADRYSFTPAVRHIQAAIQGREEPRWLALDTSLGQARAVGELAEASRGSAGR